MSRLVAVIIVLLLVLGLAVYRGPAVQATCGPAVSTPMLVKAADGAAGFGRVVRDLTEGGPSPLEVARLVREVGEWVGVLWRTMTAHARGEKEPREVRLLRRETRANTEEALLGCCAERAQLLNPEPGTPGPEEGDDGTAQPWDPRMASFTAAGVTVDCAPVTCEAPGQVPASPVSQRSAFTNEQRDIARVAVAEVRTSGIPQRLQRRAVIVALAAGFQESGVRNRPYGHSSSVGWLQLINDHGTHAQRMDPAFSVRWFYRELQGPMVKHRMGKPWTQLSVNDAAQGAQGSGYPDAYGQWRDDAERLLKDVGDLPGGPDKAPCVGSPDGAQAIGEAAPAKWRFGGQRTPDEAIAWLRAQDAANTGGWYRRCLAAARAAYGHASSGTVNGRHYAIDVWHVMPARYKVPGMAPPPRGALVFWQTDSAPGHIAVSNGDGRAWTTDGPGARGQISLVPLEVLDRWGQRLGYGAPVFPHRTQTGVQV